MITIHFALNKMNSDLNYWLEKEEGGTLES